MIGDIPEQADRVVEIIDNNKILILPEVTAEVIFVMSKFYRKDRASIASCLLELLTLDNIETACGNVLYDGIRLYRDTSLDFVDCLLCSYHTQVRYEIGTFDKKLLKLIERMDTGK